MKFRGKRFSTGFALSGAIVATVLLGNMRIAVSETGPSRIRSGQVYGADLFDPSPSSPVVRSGDVPILREVGLGNAAIGRPVLPTDSTADGDPENARLVPAIHAWNPDVRFVYFRHVSKWM